MIFYYLFLISFILSFTCHVQRLIIEVPYDKFVEQMSLELITMNFSVNYMYMKGILNYQNRIILSIMDITQMGEYKRISKTSSELKTLA